MTRREALVGLSGLVLTASGCGSAEEGEGQISSSLGGRTLRSPQLNRPINLPAVHAYSQKSVAAGRTVDFRISADQPYRMSIVRLGWNTSGPVNDLVIHQFPEVTSPVDQPIRPGSYVHIQAALSAATRLSEMTLETFVRPTKRGWMGLMGQYSYPTQCGFGLFLNAAGQAVAYFGTGGFFSSASLITGTTALALNQWHHVVATFRNGRAILYVNGTAQRTVNGLPTSVQPGTAPLRLGAYGAGQQTAQFLDGDLAMPVMYARQLSSSEINARRIGESATGPRRHLGPHWLLATDRRRGHDRGRRWAR